MKIKRYKIVPEKEVAGLAKIKINSSEVAANYVRQFFFEDIEVYESFFILMLNRNNSTVGWAKISQGGIDSTVIDTIMVAKFCIDKLAKGVILCHNHPSGELRPSDADIRITKQISNALQLLGIKVQDHIILTSESYFSLLDNGHM
ncbi:MAG: JAB domain-containing protein [Flavobacterium sp.]|nr:JAB domain-containing protein [Flavobacterium sp.]